MNRLAVSVFSVMLALVGSAQAAPITRTYNFTASDFDGTTISPVASVNGSVTITFDTSFSVSDETTGITLHALNIGLDAPIAFNYVDATDTLYIGTRSAMFGVLGFNVASDDLFLAIQNASTDPVFSSLSFSHDGKAWDANTGSVTEGAPEPVTLALFGAGLACVVATRRRRKSLSA